MAKRTSVRITGIDNARKSAQKFLTNLAGDDKMLNMLGILASDQIRNRTRARLEDYKQDEITSGTVDRRKSLIKGGNSFDNKIVTPKRSNLSLSGQLLGSISHRIDKLKSEVVLFINRPRKAYKGIRKPELENLKDNLEIKQDLEKQGRKFFFISEKLEALLQSRILTELRKQLSIYNKIIRK